MIDPIAIGQTKEYVSKQDKGDNPTIWIIGAIDSLEKAKISSKFINVEMIDGKPQVVRSKDAFVNSDFIIVQHGLKGFKNFGNVEFKTRKEKLFDHEVDIVSEDTLKCIPLEIIQELSEAVWSNNKVDEELEKN